MRQSLLLKTSSNLFEPAYNLSEFPFTQKGHSKLNIAIMWWRMINCYKWYGKTTNQSSISCSIKCLICFHFFLLITNNISVKVKYNLMDDLYLQDLCNILVRIRIFSKANQIWFIVDKINHSLFYNNYIG